MARFLYLRCLHKKQRYPFQCFQISAAPTPDVLLNVMGGMGHFWKQDQFIRNSLRVSLNTTFEQDILLTGIMDYFHSLSIFFFFLISGRWTWKDDFVIFYSQNCPKNTTRTLGACVAKEHLCNDRVTCIHQSWVCDGDSDCPGGEDEMPPLCKNVTCREDQYQCKDNTCIPGYMYCNGKRDCKDGSDEIGCCEYISI